MKITYNKNDKKLYVEERAPIPLSKRSPLTKSEDFFF